MDSERKAFLDAIEAFPLDPAPHWVYADWLDEHGEYDEATERRSLTKEKLESRAWLVGFAKGCGMNCVNYGYYGEEKQWIKDEEKIWVEITYDDVIQAGHDYIDNQDYFVQFGSEEARDLMYENGGEVARLYWHHWSVVTGHPGPDRSEDESHLDHSPFSCSC
jgi:uncharacterized protein (TIGR02996 family)